MSEIEKLYELAGVEKEMTRTNAGSIFPPFTAEKQIELIKWIMKHDEIHGDYNDDEYGFSTLNYSGQYKKDFEES